MKSLLAENGIIENQDYTVRMNSAQSEMSNIPALIDLAKNDKAGLLITFHAPVLYNAIQKAPELKKVFAIVSNPFVLGGGKSDTDHLPNLCGMYFKSPIDGLLDLIKEASPKIKKIGVVFTIGEDESVAYKDELANIAKSKHIEIVSQGYATMNEIVDAVNSLITKKIDALIHIPDANDERTLVVLSKLSETKKIPMFGLIGDPNLKAVISYSAGGKEVKQRFASIVLRVLKGEDINSMPFDNTETIQKRIKIDKKTAKNIGFKIPDSIMKKADQIIE